MRLLIATLMLAPPAFAQTSTIDQAPVQHEIAQSCSFVTECFDAEVCTETAFDVTLTGKSGGASEDALVVEAQISDDTGDTAMLGQADADGMMLFSTGDTNALRILTVDASGASRLTQHFKQGPMAITYLGTCE